MKKSLTIPKEIFEHLIIDPESETGLRWIKPTLSQIKPFSEAGFKRYHIRTGRPEAIVVGFKGKEYKSHRVIWTFINGEIPDGMIIDHIDGNPFNNAISNLKIKTQPENNLNSSKRSHNTSGETGVYFNYDKRKQIPKKQWIAYWIGEDGKKKSKTFSCEKYGDDLAFNLAAQARNLAIKELILKGKDYTERHGK